MYSLFTDPTAGNQRNVFQYDEDSKEQEYFMSLHSGFPPLADKVLDRLNSALKDLPPIPKKVHLTWKDKNIANSNFTVARNGVRNLIDLNPDWSVEISDDADVDEYLKAKLDLEDWSRIKDCHIVEKVDLWRLLKVYHEGGYYHDIERQVNVPFAAVLQSNQIKMYLPTHFDVNFAQDIMFSSPGNPLLKHAIDVNLHRRQIGGYSIIELGPYGYLLGLSEYLMKPFSGFDRATSKQMQIFRDIIKQSPYAMTAKEGDTSLLSRTRNELNELKTAGFTVANGMEMGTGGMSEFYMESGVDHWAGRYGERQSKQSISKVHA